ncbi:MAG: VWA domain-containing protein [Myxococcales bacterium]|nr:VWA domain-containing protein [Myxococcales bacterium]
MTRRWIPGSLLALTVVASCAGGAREVGQQAVETQRTQQANNSAGGASETENYRVIAASGSATGTLARPVSQGRDESPTLVTVRGRSEDTNRAVNVAVAPGSVPGVVGPGAVPTSGGFIVRRAGAATSSGAPSGGGATRSSATSDGAGEAEGLVGLGNFGTSASSASTGSAPSSLPRAQSAAPTGRRAPSETRLRAATQPTPVSAAVGSTPGGSTFAAGRGWGSGSGGGMAADEAPPVGGRVAVTGAPVARPVPVGVVPVGSTVTVTTTVAVTPPVIVEAQQETAGLLTAASVGDADRFTNYLDYLSRHTSEAGELRLDMTRRLRIKVVDSQNRGVNAARIRISNQMGTVEALTHADGSFDYFPGMSTAQLAGVARLDVSVESVTVGAEVQIPTQGDGQPVLVRLNAAVVPPAPVLDLGFLIDVTGSMGDELRYVNREIASIVQRIERDSPGVRVRLSATFYRDRVDDNVVQQIPFTSNVQGFAAAMQNVYASGGGDYPEDLNAGIDAAMNRLAWSDGAAVRVLVLVADAPPQHYGDTNFTYREAMVRASQRGIRLLPVAASGSDRRVEFLFRAMGAYTSTPYVYLTDDSGVGGSHMEADTDRVAVERFNDALVRLITSDLRGQGMHEPGRLGAERN